MGKDKTEIKVGKNEHTILHEKLWLTHYREAALNPPPFQTPNTTALSAKDIMHGSSGDSRFEYEIRGLLPSLSPCHTCVCVCVSERRLIAISSSLCGLCNGGAELQCGLQPPPPDGGAIPNSHSANRTFAPGNRS